MTRFLFYFQETSPLITYNGWVEGSSLNDTLASSYSGSFRATSTAGATASFTFSGTAVSLFGAMRPNHGNYSVKLDQHPLFEASGWADPSTFNRTLWSTDGLAYTQHSVTLTNIPASTGQYVDLDFVSIERQIGLDGDPVYESTFDDFSSAVRYSGSWVKSTGVATAYQSTLHTTTVANSQATISFRGCCIELYGQYANAPYSVTLDNEAPVNMTGVDVDLTPDLQHPQTLLYLNDGLSEGNHTTTLTNLVSNVNRPFSFDYAVVSSTKNSTSSGAATSVPSAALQSSSPGTSYIPIGAIAGASAGGAVILILLSVAAFLFMRRRRRHNSETRPRMDLIDSELVEPKPYILTDRYPGPIVQPTSDRGGPYSPSKRHRGANYFPQDESTSEVLLGAQEPSAGGSDLSAAASLSTTGATRSRTAPQSASASQRETKMQASSLQHTSPSESVENPPVREQDAGAVISPGDELRLRTLPPAYNPEWHQNQS